MIYEESERNESTGYSAGVMLRGSNVQGLHDSWDSNVQGLHDSCISKQVFILKRSYIEVSLV